MEGEDKLSVNIVLIAGQGHEIILAAHTLGDLGFLKVFYPLCTHTHTHTHTQKPQILCVCIRVGESVMRPSLSRMQNLVFVGPSWKCRNRSLFKWNPGLADDCLTRDWSQHADLADCLVWPGQTVAPLLLS